MDEMPFFAGKFLGFWDRRYFSFADSESIHGMATMKSTKTQTNPGHLKAEGSQFRKLSQVKLQFLMPSELIQSLQKGEDGLEISTKTFRYFSATFKNCAGQLGGHRQFWRPFRNEINSKSKCQIL
jgi:hypothetical protein